MNYPQIKPTLNLDFSNTKTLDPRITFRRGTPGAYYDGKTYAKAEENLLSYSEDFSQWGYGRIVKTSAQSAPDGSSGAYKIEQESGQTSSGYLLQTYTTSANESYTFSVYAKAGTNRNYVVLRTYLSNSRFTYFDLVNGEAVNIDDHHVATIQDAGNGWYRCNITYTPVSSSNVQFNVYFSDNDSSITVADDGGFIYLWGAQLEQRKSVTSYTKTDGTPVTKYQPQLMFASPDQPRFDHDVLTGKSKGLLIEESRTNLFEYSEGFSSWQYNSNVVVKNNNIVAPSGTVSASQIVETSSNSQHNVAQTISITGQKTFSLFVKKGAGSRNFRITDYNSTDGEVSVTYNLSTGDKISEAGSPNSNIDNYSNGWYRISMTSTTTTSSTYYIQLMDNNNTTYTGDGYSSIYIWGAQLEEGSFATSYIKTSGASATRSADNASITGENFSSWYRQDEGSLYSEVSTSDFRSSYPRFIINDGTASNRIVTSFFGQQGLRIQSDSNDYINVSNAVSSDNGNYHKRAIALKKDSFSFYTDGESILSDYAGEMPISVNTFTFYNNLAADGADYLNGHIKKIAYYPQHLTNEQLQQLTK